MSAKQRNENFALRMVDFVLNKTKGKSVRTALDLTSFHEYEEELDKTKSKQVSKVATCFVTSM